MYWHHSDVISPEPQDTVNPYPNQYPQAPYPQNPYPNQVQPPPGAYGAPQMPPAGSMDSILDDVDHGEKAGGSSRLPRIPDGNHVLLIDAYEGFPTRSDGMAIGAEFVVETSDTLPPGTRCGTAWFPSAKNVDRQKFERGRVAEFCAVIDGGLNQAPRTTKDVGRDLVNGPSGEMPKLRGFKVRCSAWKKVDRKTGALVLGKNGPVFEYSWQAIPSQTYESAAASSKTMPAQLPRAAARPVIPHAATQPQYAPPQYQQGYAPPPAQSAYPTPGMMPPGAQGAAPAPAPAPGLPPGLPPGYPVPPAQAYTNPYGAPPAPQGAPVPPNFVAGLRG